VKRILVALFIFAATMLQMAIFSQFKIQAGKADLLLLVIVALGLQNEIPKVDKILFSILAGIIIGFISAEPFWITVIIYTVAVYFCLILRERLPQIPLVSMFFVSMVFMFFHLVIQSVYYQFLGFQIEFQYSFQNIILPSLMINIIATLPVYFVVSEIRRLVYPSLEEM